MYSTRENITGLECTLVSKTTDSPIKISRASMNSTYSIGGRSGVSVLDFTIEEPGAYEFSGWYSKSMEGPEVVLAIGLGFTGKVMKAVFGGLAILFGSAIFGVAIAVRTFLMRRKAKILLEGK